MASEKIYDSQVAPREAPPLPLQSPAALGAGVGEMLQQAGAMRHEQDLRSYQLERKQIANQELAAFERKLAEHKLRMGDQVRALRQGAKPGGEGHADAVDEANRAAKGDLLDGITDPTIADHARQQWDGWSGELHNSEANWQTGKTIERQIDDTAQGNNLSANVVRQGGGDKAVWERELKGRLGAIELMHTDADTKEKLRIDAENSLGTGFLLGLRDKDPQAALAAIDSGAFNYLPANTLEQLRNGSEVEILRAKAAAEHQQRVAAAQAGDAIQVLETKFRDGIEIADADFEAAIQLAVAIGDKPKAESLRGMQADNKFAHVWSGQAPLVRQNRVAALQAKPKRSEAEDRELKWLTDHREALDSRFNGDPVGFAMENAPRGMGPPPGDVLGDPAALNARKDWYRVNKQVYGPQMQLFSKAEVERINLERHNGPQGQQRVLGMLDQLPADVRIVAARQLAPSEDPDDALFRQLVFINPQTRGVMIAGSQALKANPQLLKPPNPNSPAAIELGQYRLAAGQAMRLRSPSDVDATNNLAMFYVAGYMAQNGWATIDQVPKGFIARAYRQALGGQGNAQGSVGGLQSWGDHLYLLPSRHSQSSFAAALFADSQARNVRPVNPDGSPFDVRYATPMFMGLDPKDPEVWLYRFELSGGRVVQSSAGGDYVARVRDKR